MLSDHSFGSQEGVYSGVRPSWEAVGNLGYNPLPSPPPSGVHLGVIGGLVHSLPTTCAPDLHLASPRGVLFKAFVSPGLSGPSDDSQGSSATSSEGEADAGAGGLRRYGKNGWTTRG